MTGHETVQLVTIIILSSAIALSLFFSKREKRVKRKRKMDKREYGVGEMDFYALARFRLERRKKGSKDVMKIIRESISASSKNTPYISQAHDILHKRRIGAS